MDYRVDATRIQQRTSRSVLLVTAAVVMTITVVLGGLALAAGGQSDPRVAAEGSPARPASVDPTASVVSPILPSEVHCHDLASDRCARLAEAALSAAVDPSLPGVTNVDVWATLICGSTFDCPVYHLAGRYPAGSVIVHFATPFEVWVNVTEFADDRESDPFGPKLDAWVIRSGAIR